MPTASSSTPAWDPSSQTPLVLASQQSPAEITADNTLPSQWLNSPATDPSASEHILLHPSFLNLTLNVIANGGKYEHREIPATITMMYGHLAMLHVLKKTSHALEPEWITPKHPSPTHDNGLLIVIKGEHHGKYLRRLYHDGYGRTALMIAAVVEKVEGSEDCITGEHLKISCDLLCTVKEPAEESKIMKPVMYNAHERYREYLHSL